MLNSKLKSGESNISLSPNAKCFVILNPYAKCFVPLNPHAKCFVHFSPYAKCFVSKGLEQYSIHFHPVDYAKNTNAKSLLPLATHKNLLRQITL